MLTLPSFFSSFERFELALLLPRADSRLIDLLFMSFFLNFLRMLMSDLFRAAAGSLLLSRCALGMTVLFRSCTGYCCKYERSIARVSDGDNALLTVFESRERILCRGAGDKALSCRDSFERCVSFGPPLDTCFDRCERNDLSLCDLRLVRVFA